MGIILEKNKEYIALVEDLGTDGEGVCKIYESLQADTATLLSADITSQVQPGVQKKDADCGDGITVFVKNTVIGDVVRILITKAKKNFGYGRLLEVIHPSPNRIEPRCKASRRCGGCTLQCVSYAEQLEFKRRKVENNLVHIGGFKGINVLPTLGMAEPWHYRNKAQVPFGMEKGKLVAGFYAGHTHTIIDNEDCLIAPEINRHIISIIKNFMLQYGIKPYDESSGKGIVRHALIRVGYHTGQIMVCLIINSDTLMHSKELVSALCAVEGMTTVCLNINKNRNNVILGERIVTLYGPGYMEDRIGDITFRISPQSFFQVNPQQTEVLYGKALEYAGLTGTETVWDLYCGIGTISLFLARCARKVYGVEIIPAAIEDARGNAKRNGITNAEFFVGKAEEILPAWHLERRAVVGAEKDAAVDVVVVDPPRKGCDRTLLDTIADISPKRIVYVSCDSATLARDLKYLSEKGYQILQVQPVDMFAWSCHVETVVLLSQRKPDDIIRVGIDLDELDITAAESKATYQELKDYILKTYGLKVSSLYISQVKRKHGLDVGENYNLAKNENPKVPICPPEKEDAIVGALKHFQML